MSALTVTLVLGFTESDRAGNYFPMMDGYRAGARQVTRTVEVAGAAQSGRDWAEAAFIATNAPVEQIGRDEFRARSVYLALGQPPRSLSVGDTVTVDGTVYECKRVGWEQV